MKEKKKLLNDQIKANKVQLISDSWENLWEMSLYDAKIKAKDLWLDLMEIWRKWQFSIVKILDYWKYLYRQKKQDQKNKQKWKAPELKTLRISFKIGDHDLEIRKKQAEKFANLWHPLKVTLMLRGRENNYANLASEKMKAFVEKLEDIYKLESPIKKAGNTFIAMLKTKK